MKHGIRLKRYYTSRRTPQFNKKRPLLIVHIPRTSLDLQPEGQHTLGVLDNLITAELALAVHSIHKGDGHLGNRAAHSLGPDHHLHLERISLALGARDDLLQHALLVQAETTSQVAHAGPQDGVGKQVGSAADKLALQVPAIHAAVAGVARARDDVVVALLLDGNHLRDELGVVAKVGVHDDDKVARDELQAVDVGGAETQLAGSGLEDDVGSVGLDELEGDFLGSVRGAVVDDDQFPVEVPIRNSEILAWILRQGGVSHF